MDRYLRENFTMEYGKALYSGRPVNKKTLKHKYLTLFENKNINKNYWKIKILNPDSLQQMYVSLNSS